MTIGLILFVPSVEIIAVLFEIQLRISNFPDWMKVTKTVNLFDESRKLVMTKFIYNQKRTTSKATKNISKIEINK
jgi:hypothetical protein